MSGKEENEFESVLFNLLGYLLSTTGITLGTSLNIQVDYCVLEYS